MPVKEYLYKKYGFSDDTKIPVSFLLEELLVTENEIKQMVKELLNRRAYPQLIAFSDFCLICTYFITLKD